MKIFATTALCATLMTAGSASADVLLEVDLSVVNTITITATPGLSDATASGSPFTGFYLADFFGGASSTLDQTNIVGDITSAANPADNSPFVFRSDGVDSGLNIWAYTSDATSTFTAGETAFSGSLTFNVDPTAYADVLTGGGTIHFPADDAASASGASVLGEWAIVPEPSSLALLGLGGLALLRRRRQG